MCRLFGLHTGANAVTATFWLLDAADSLAAQSRRNPDGAGIGVFGEDGVPFVDKQPIAAWEDAEFASAARDLRGTTFVAHVRYASSGNDVMANTHPFLQDNRLLAHNGVVAGLDELDARLRELDVRDLVEGDTDSERVFALVTAEIRRHGGDVEGGLVEAVGWISNHLPVYALNLVLGTATDLWALRYPDTHELYLLERSSGGAARAGSLDMRSPRISAQSEHLANAPSVLVASEKMDDDAGWRLLDSGELLHVDVDLRVTASHPFPAAPRHRLGLGDLSESATASQQSRSSSSAPSSAPRQGMQPEEPG